MKCRHATGCTAPNWCAQVGYCDGVGWDDSDPPPEPDMVGFLLDLARSLERKSGQTATNLRRLAQGYMARRTSR